MSDNGLTGDRGEAHDLLADVQLTAQEHWDRVGSTASAGGYVRRMLTSRFLDQQRARVRRRTTTSADLPDIASLDAGQGRMEDHDTVARVLAHPSPRQKAALVVRYYLDLSDSDIAAELGCSKSTVRSPMARGVSSLRLAAVAAAHTEGPDREPT